LNYAEQHMVLKDKIVLITGSTGELGTVVIRRFQEEGARLVLTYRKEKGIEKYPETIQREHKNVLLVQTDLTREDDVINLFNSVHQRFNGLHIVCNIAGGFIPDKALTEVSLDEWNGGMALNLTSCFLSCREALKLMKNNTYGRIINISARSGIYPEPNKGAYGVSKAGVAFLTKILSKETQRTGITVNALAPSIILTEANKEWGDPAEMKHWVKPEELAEIIVFLCKNKAQTINGMVIEVFGGV
jgi:3-oxoacyl-[acyl-carrier protein] reductase